jgi:ATP-dependent DNA ligase
LIEEFGVEGIALCEVRKRGGKALESEARKHGWAGIVAKRADSIYEPGETSENWRVIDFSAP